MIKTCIVCGKEFEAARHNYVCCSKECTKYNCQYGYRLSSEKYKKVLALRERVRNNRQRKCRICGKTIEREKVEDELYKQIHEQCIIDDCVKSMKAGKRMTNTQFSRLYSRGYTVRDLKETILNGEL